LRAEPRTRLITSGYAAHPPFHWWREEGRDYARQAGMQMAACNGNLQRMIGCDET
jgi:hypothetical protein